MSSAILSSSTPRGRPNAGMLALLVVLVGMTGCSVANTDVPAETASPLATSGPTESTAQPTPSSPATDGDATELPSAEQETATEDAALQRTIDDALTDLVGSSPQPSREQVRDTLIAGGIPADRLEISASTTPTGLEVDFIQAGVRSDDMCVVAYIRDGAVSSAVLPLLSNGLCFLGSDRG